MQNVFVSLILHSFPYQIHRHISFPSRYSLSTFKTPAFSDDFKSKELPQKGHIQPIFVISVNVSQNLRSVQNKFQHGLMPNRQLEIDVNVFLYLGFLSRTFRDHRTSEEGGGRYFESSLPLSPAAQTLRHQPGDYCGKLTSAHSQQPDSNRERLVSERKSLTTKFN